MADLLSNPQTIDRRLDALFTRLQENQAIQYYLLAVILVLAALLRFYKLGEWSFWIDEIFTINRAQAHFSDALLFLRRLPSTLWIPLSVVLTEISLKTFGVTEWSARLGPNLIGIASIPILFFTARRFAGQGAALILALLLALSPWHIFWSQNARFYTSLLLFYTLAGFAFFYAIERDRPVYILIFYVLFYFAISERLIAGFILPVVLVYLVILRVLPGNRPAGLNKRNMILLVIPLLGAVLIDVLRYINTGSSIILDVFTEFGNPVGSPSGLFLSIFYNIGFPVASMAAFGGLLLLVNKNRAGLFILLSAVLPVVVVIGASKTFFTDERYIFMTLPYWFILAGVAIKELYLRTQGFGKLISTGVLIMLASGLFANLLIYEANHGNRHNWKAAFETVKEQAVEGDLIVTWWNQFGPIYLGEEILSSRDLSPQSVAASQKRHWFLVDSWSQYFNLELLQWLPENSQLIDVIYLRTPDEDKSIRIYLYDPVP